MKRCLALLCVLALAVLGYGYWHGATHGAFSISLRLAGEKTQGSQILLAGAEVVLRDTQGLELARGRMDRRYNFVRLVHPAVGDCQDAEQAAAGSSAGRSAWQACFEAQSRWIPAWAEKVHSISLSTPGCRWPEIPVKVRTYGPDWLLWWVPLPHVGGKPYTYYSLSVSLPPPACGANP
ncbi:hypothetical protein [Marinobacterium rhizophilum]|uniref:Uncharacterized protein n=1 Tax=Marinobacterium rhizophilum TaxID=420402 RepID=A0ABY5HK55_9GAMM|nr:hypothetical protein [Marinobacterium rhizophilum]UTW12765.1 hypothetical protein KDW95_03555 [Marinobacterium rhizophilum]